MCPGNHDRAASIRQWRPPPLFGHRALFERRLGFSPAEMERKTLVQVAAVHRFEPRSSLALSDGVKGVHVLPFVPNFGNMVARLEELHAATDAGRRLLDQQGVHSKHIRAAATPVRGSWN